MISAEGGQKYSANTGLVFCVVLHTDIHLLVQRRLILSHTYAYAGEFITHHFRPSRDRDRIPLKCHFCSVLTRLIGYRNTATGDEDFLRSTGALFCIDTVKEIPVIDDAGSLRNAGFLLCIVLRLITRHRCSGRFRVCETSELYCVLYMVEAGRV